jgi:DNA-binding response OmpR family regulator
MGKIILIEDDLNSARLAARLLEKAGHQVATAREGEQGLTLIAENQPDIVLVDLGLPDMDGQTIIAMLRQQIVLKGTPILAITSWPKELANSMIQAYGCDGLIVKPINTRTFAAEVGTYLRE